MSLRTLRKALETRAHHVSAFLMLGDPSPDISVQLAVAAVDEGATMLELGFPFSDPCADGPAIQESVLRARAAGVSTTEALEILGRIHESLPDVPLNLLVYGNLVHARGYDTFCRQIADAGASTILVPDIPLEEDAALRAAVDANSLGHVSLVGPLTDPERLARIDANTTGFLYVAGYQGVTGRTTIAADTYDDVLRDTLARVANPICLGFGISEPVHVEHAFRAGAPMVVVGSHLARAIERAAKRSDAADTNHNELIIESFRQALSPLTAIACRTPGESRCS